MGCLMSCLMVGGIQQARAEQFVVRDAGIELVDNVYRLNADLDFVLPPAVYTALNSGVILTLALDIEVLEPREYLWNREIAALEQRYELQHHAFSGQYLLHNLNSGAHLNFSSLQSALFSLGSVRQLPVIDAHLLNKNADYLIRVRARLDYDSLPVPLQLKAYVSSDWHLDSDWYTWMIKAGPRS